MSKHPPTPPQPFEAEFVDGVRHIFEERIVFNKLLGLKLIDVAADHVLGRVDMRPELVGHFSYNRMHGGVISA
ncbi:MAG: thioesterase family protein, partial [Ottowia sp.]|nr:thioesterase family protein [Ottowia sp.]